MMQKPSLLPKVGGSSFTSCYEIDCKVAKATCDLPHKVKKENPQARVTPSSKLRPYLHCRGGGDRGDFNGTARPQVGARAGSAGC